MDGMLDTHLCYTYVAVHIHAIACLPERGRRSRRATNRCARTAQRFFHCEVRPEHEAAAPQQRKKQAEIPCENMCSRLLALDGPSARQPQAHSGRETSSDTIAIEIQGKRLPTRAQVQEGGLNFEQEKISSVRHRHRLSGNKAHLGLGRRLSRF